jgi:hypothetical protein
MSVSTAWRAVALALALATATTGCFPPSSKLENGESVNSGQGKFDDYFDKVADFRDRVDKLDSDLFTVREPLVESMDMNPDSSMTQVTSRARRRAAKYRDYGVMLNLRLTPEPKVRIEKGAEVELDAKYEAVIEGVEQSATRAMQAFREYQKLLAEADELESKRPKLADRVDKIPEKDESREVVEVELVAAGRVLKKAAEKLERDSRVLSHYLVGLAAAVDTGAEASFEEKCESAIARRPAPRQRFGKAAAGRGRPTGRRPAARRPAPRPAPKPAPPPAGGTDFDM